MTTSPRSTATRSNPTALAPATIGSAPREKRRETSESRDAETESQGGGVAGIATWFTSPLTPSVLDSLLERERRWVNLAIDEA
eukprot:CAMPEP_0175920578 /NCGR_PEP_ID=MMETSP0108-20121206/13001_1 /TAXON_ID=195067 ORGANISM="Goniomonas pacifica, Strain CCMP1869" /NCGR_SAMPLE_ID=MMETSP0108 /ASSEMBLY_ACC=CAM_ASM_000204 /LENGTH=82 /DNA_ID=CAMNT_0017243299 /DNA_START=380 /DNA_END=625 /DNA_ORIENTATION=+